MESILLLKLNICPYNTSMSTRCTANFLNSRNFGMQNGGSKYHESMRCHRNRYLRMMMTRTLSVCRSKKSM